MRASNALDLEKNVFTKRSPRAVACRARSARCWNAPRASSESSTAENLPAHPTDARDRQ